MGDKNDKVIRSHSIRKMQYLRANFKGKAKQNKTTQNSNTWGQRDRIIVKGILRRELLRLNYCM